MKRIVLLVAMIVPGVIAESQVISEEVRITCKFLAESVDRAIKQDQKPLVVAYCNAYDGIAANYSVPEDCKGFFKSIKDIYGDRAGSWIFSLNNAPITPFTHKEVEVMRFLREKNYVDVDKLQKMMNTNVNQNKGQLKAKEFSKDAVKEPE